MRPSLRVVALTLAMLALLGLGPNGSNAPSISTGALLADADVLQRTYETLHPGLYRYNTPQQMDANFAALRSELSRAADLQRAFLAFARFTATLQCGHSYPNFYNQPDAIANALFQRQDRVPFYFRWIDHSMVVTRNVSGDRRLAPGTTILSINGMSSEHILAALLPLARADGANDAKRVDQMGVQGNDRYEAFDLYFPMLFPQSTTTMALRVREIDGSEAGFSVTALTYEQRIAPIAAKLAAAHGGTQPLWSFRFLAPKVAELVMPTWDVYETKWDWQAFLNRAFAEIDAKRPAKLIIDLRGNEGGSDVGRALLAHMIDRPLQLDARIRLVRYRAVPPDISPYLTTWDPSFKDWGPTATPYDARFFRLASSASDDGGAAIAPIAPRLRSAVFVLVDASNSSATFNFEEAAQQAHLAKLVGSPTGGNQRGINGGAFFFVHLPNSHIEIDLPLIGTFAAQPRPNAGLTPDIPVSAGPKDLARGSDPVFAAALAAR